MGAGGGQAVQRLGLGEEGAGARRGVEGGGTGVCWRGGGGNTGSKKGVKEGEEEYVGGGVGSRGQEKGMREGEDKYVRGEGARRGQEMGLRGNKSVVWKDD